MRFIIDAACGCNTGRLRENNEDNFYFDGKCLESDNNGLRDPVGMEMPVKEGLCVAVFDGMGGESYGEIASYRAARQMQLSGRTLVDHFVPARKYLERLVQQINDAVVSAGKELCAERMGSTIAALYFTSRNVYVCNVGDSRAYRIRYGEFLQISEDHVRRFPGRESKKAPLTQCLGIDPEELRIEPYIAKGDLQRGDQYLLCSDGLTDMLANFEICDIMFRNEDPVNCVEELIRAALERGGRDNITAIVCRIK